MHGLGNDFVVVNGFYPGREDYFLDPISSHLAERLLDRHFGVGGDQLLWLRPAESPSADVIMEIFNPDGSRAEMCGNGIRAVALYLHLLGIGTRSGSVAIQTAGGLKRVQRTGQDRDLTFEVDMGVPKLGQTIELTVLGRKVKLQEINMGNPHAVLFVKNHSELPVEQFGPAIESDPRFPSKTNVEFVVPKDDRILVQDWERGAGKTLACGTGACAAAVATFLGEWGSTHQTSEILVQLPGGKLKIEWKGPGQPVKMTGPATFVFSGRFEIAD